MIEQLSTTYPYKRAWRWTGQQWNIAHSGLRESYLPLALCIVIVLLVIWLPIALHAPASSKNIIPLSLIAVLLATLTALILWLAYRR